jgi:hypothetical protein
MRGSGSTTVRVSQETRDALARIGETELQGASVDEVLQVLIFEHRTRAAFARMDADGIEGYRREAVELGEVDVAPDW